MEKFHTSSPISSSDYLNQANSSLLTIVQIETAEALADVDAIANTSGVDILFIGPFDLGNNIGHPIIDGKMHENLDAAIDKILKASINAGKKAGMFCTSGEQAKKYADMGFHMISAATDMFVLPMGLASSLAAATGSGEVPKMSGPYGK